MRSDKPLYKRISSVGKGRLSGVLVRKYSTSSCSEGGVATTDSNRTLLLQKAQTELDSAIRDHALVSTDPATNEKIRQVANGFFQSEGTVSARIRRGEKLVIDPFCYNGAKLYT